MTVRRPARPRLALWAPVAACALAMFVGCTSNRFQLANDPKIDRKAELAEIDNRLRQMPSTPGAAPRVNVPLVAGDPTLDRPRSRIQPDDDEPVPAASPADLAANMPAATYPPAAAAPPDDVADPNGFGAGSNRPGETALAGQPRLGDTPRPGPVGSLIEPQAEPAQILGRVVSSYGRPEPNASIQVYDLTRGRQLAAELASGPDGRFRISQLQPGVRYEIVAGTSGRGMRYTGSTVAVPPEGSAQIRLEPENRTRNVSGGDSPSLFGADGLWKKTGLAALGGKSPTEPALGTNVRVSTPRMTTDARPVSSGAEDDAASVLENAAARTPEPPAERPKVAPSALMSMPIITKDGGDARIEFLAGDLILLDFFGSWCGPCKKAIPHLNELHAKYAARGLHIVGVATESGSRTQRVGTLQQTVGRFGINYTTVLSPGEYGAHDSLRDSLGVTSFPTFVLIDRAGQVLYRGQGGDEGSVAQLDAAIAQRLGELGK